MLDVPLAIVDATVLTEAGYVGEDVETILTTIITGFRLRSRKSSKRNCVY